MGTISDKLKHLEVTKDVIRAAIEARDVAVADTDTFRSYATKILKIGKEESDTTVDYAALFTDASDEQKADTMDILNVNLAASLELKEWFKEHTPYETWSPSNPLYYSANKIFVGTPYDGGKTWIGVGDTYHAGNISIVDWDLNSHDFGYSNYFKLPYGVTQATVRNGVDKVTGFSNSWYATLARLKYVNVQCSRTSLASYFEGRTNLVSFETDEVYDTSAVTSMQSMFYNCQKLESVDALANWDVSSVTSMQSMFNNCQKLESVDGLANWDVSSVTSMTSMFYNCQKLESVDALANWDVSSVTSMQSMFNNCQKLESVDGLANWDVSSVTSMTSMFYNCQKLESVDALANWDVSSVTSMYAMFNNCKALTKCDLHTWRPKPKGELGGGWSGMFAESSKLTEVNLSGWDTSGVTATSTMFNSCGSLTRVDLSGWDTSNNTSMSIMFRGCSNLEWVDISNWNAAKVTSFGWQVYWCFGYCDKLTTLIGDHTIEEVEAGTIKTLIGCTINPHISDAANLERPSLLAVIKGLADMSSGTAVSLPLATKQKAKLTEADIAEATAKGWTIS